MTDKNRIIAIGLLTQRDLDRLGDGFNRMFPADKSDDFQDLLNAIDRADAARGNVIGPSKRLFGKSR